MDNTASKTTVDGLTNRVTTIESRFPVIDITKTIAIGTDWTDTGIIGPDLPPGGYIVHFDGIYCGSSTWEVLTRYTGIMSWYEGETNSSEVCEISLHHSGHATGAIVQLRTLTHPRLDSSPYMHLQIKANGNTSNARSVTFHFLKLF